MRNKLALILVLLLPAAAYATDPWQYHYHPPHWPQPQIYHFSYVPVPAYTAYESEMLRRQLAPSVQHDQYRHLYYLNQRANFRRDHKAAMRAFLLSK